MMFVNVLLAFCVQAHAATNTVLAPTRTIDFNANVVQYNEMGIEATVAAGKSTNIDLKMTDDVDLTGGDLLVKGGAFGDYCLMQVVDVDNVLGYGAGVVLRQFVNKFYVSDVDVKQKTWILNYPAKVIAGLYLRVTSVSTGVTAPQVAMNYDLHRITQ